MIKDQLDTEALLYLAELRKQHDELVLPVELWRSHIENNPSIQNEDIPPHRICGDFVITERSWFRDVIMEASKSFYYQPRRLTKEQGGFWFLEKLEQKKKMPKHDIFDVGQRQPGSFNSNG